MNLASLADLGTKLNPYRLAIEIGAIVLAVVLTSAIIGTTWHRHNLTEQAIGAQRVIDADRKAAEKQAAAVAAQEKADAQKLADAHRAHEAEIADLAQHYAADRDSVSHALIVCRSTLAPRPDKVLADSGLPARPDGPAGNGSGSNALPDRDIGPALRMFAARLDSLNADARELDRVTH